MANKPFGVDQSKRIEVPEGLKSEGVDPGGGIFNKYFNQALLETTTDRIWAEEAQVKDSPATATFYTDGSGNPLDASDAAVTILKDDKILIRHNTTQTANLLLDCGGVKVAIEMYGGVTLDMDTFDLTLGVTAGDEFSGSIRVTSDSTAETLTVLESSGLRVETDSITVANLAGDIIVNNSPASTQDANIDAKDLTLTYISTTTADLLARSLKLLNSSNSSVVVNDVSETFNTATASQRHNSASLLNNTWYDGFAGATSGGALELKMAPVLSATTDGTTAFELVDSSENFTTNLIQIGDFVFNDTNGTFAKVTDITNAASGRLFLDTDIFASGDDYTIRIQSPDFSTGFSFIGRVGHFYIDSGGLIDNTERVLWYLCQQEFAEVYDVKTTGVDGGTFTLGAWRTRDINTFVTNIIGFNVVLNQIIIPKGVYKKFFRLPAYIVQDNQGRYYNVTDSVEVQMGSSEYAQPTSSPVHSFIDIPSINVVKETIYEAQHQSIATHNSSGFGRATGIGSSEVYTTGNITKIG